MSTITAKQTHKAKPEFVLIESTDIFNVFTLKFDPGVEDRLCDHQTGHHVAGMVLVEAARQAAAVVLERSFPELSESHAAVLSEIRTAFNGYCFVGVPVTLTVSVSSFESGSRVDTDVQVAIRQGDSNSADVRLRIALLPRAVLRRCERLARMKIK